MFGQLVHAYHVKKDMDKYIEDADAIFAEAKRLMLGPWENNGNTELSFVRVGSGVKLNLETGKWVRSNGGMAVRLRHMTEYMNSVRYAFILIDEMTLWRRSSDY